MTYKEAQQALREKRIVYLNDRYRVYQVIKRGENIACYVADDNRYTWLIISVDDNKSLKVKE